MVESDKREQYGAGAIQTFKRIAKRPPKIGEILRGSGKKPLASRFQETEEIIERNRPSSLPDRGNCVYMRVDNDFSQTGVSFNKGFVHSVEPLGTAHKRDTYWIGVLQRRYFSKSPLQKDLAPTLTDDAVAQNYWSGKAGPDPTWEWVTESAKVIDVSANTVLVRPNANLLNFKFDKEQ